jgi:hypothetical protein
MSCRYKIFGFFVDNTFAPPRIFVLRLYFTFRQLVSAPST